jgi:hypothetical protein
MITRLKKQHIEWEKIFVSYTSNKGLITSIYREFKKLKFQRINDPVKKWANALNRAFSKKEVQMAKKKHMKKCSTFLAINEMMPSHYCQNGYRQEQKQTITNVGEVV